MNSQWSIFEYYLGYTTAALLCNRFFARSPRKSIPIFIIKKYQPLGILITPEGLNVCVFLRPPIMARLFATGTAVVIDYEGWFCVDCGSPLLFMFNPFRVEGMVAGLFATV